MPQLCVGKKECGLCLKPPFPEGAFYVVEGAMTKSKSTGIWPWTSTRRPVSLCPPKALDMYGKRMTVDEVLDEVEKDGSFYRSPAAASP